MFTGNPNDFPQETMFWPVTNIHRQFSKPIKARSNYINLADIKRGKTIARDCKAIANNSNFDS